MNVAEDTTIVSLLTSMEEEAARIATETYTEAMAPILRQVSGYRGEFTVSATSTMKLDVESNQIKNSINLGITFPTTAFDLWEEAQRVILVEAFRQLMIRNS